MEWIIYLLTQRKYKIFPERGLTRGGKSDILIITKTEWVYRLIKTTDQAGFSVRSVGI